MHVMTKEIRDLAGCYLNNKILNDKQLTVKKHMSLCDLCYEKFCAEYLILKELTESNALPLDEILTESDILSIEETLAENFVSPLGERLTEGSVFPLEEKLTETSAFSIEETFSEKKETQTQLQKVFLQIKIVKEKLKIFIDENLPNKADWEFLYIPQVAARGDCSKVQAEVYMSKISEYSYIKKVGNKIIIQLDGEVFPVEQIAVLVTIKNEKKLFEFHYDETEECYQLVLEAGELEQDAIIEIVKI